MSHISSRLASQLIESLAAQINQETQSGASVGERILNAANDEKTSNPSFENVLFKYSEAAFVGGTSCKDEASELYQFSLRQGTDACAALLKMWADKQAEVLGLVENITILRNKLEALTKKQMEVAAAIQRMTD